MPVRIVVGGAIAQAPIRAGGNTWAFLQYVLGFRQLGCEVLYVEHLDAAHCIAADWSFAPFTESANARLFAAVVDEFGLAGGAALLQRDGGEWCGLSHRHVRAWAADADLFVNLSGRFHIRDILDAPRRRMYVDLDPGFTQIWQAGYGADMNLPGHDVYVTVGLNVGRPDCPVPTLGLPWQPTLPPVVRNQWQPVPEVGDAYTTVADWRGYAPIEWNGVWYKQKADEFVRLIDLPSRTPYPLEICLAIHENEPDLPRLRAHGWRLSDPNVHAADAHRYREYVRRSRGEFSVAKHGYVVGRTGWVSDRTACYLAAGRPAVVQDTGLAGHLPLGTGLLVFADIDEAAGALRAVEDEYACHAAAASRLAEEQFDSDRVLTRLLDLAGVRP
jgi:hypothetical protein